MQEYWGPPDNWKVKKQKISRLELVVSFVVGLLILAAIVYSGVIAIWGSGFEPFSYPGEFGY